MSGKREIIIYGAVILAVAAAAYLWASHYHIYHRISAVGLKAVSQGSLYIAGSDKATARNLTYAAIGDSLTAGVGTRKYEESFPYVLTQTLAERRGEKIILNNFSYSGAKTSDLLTNLLPRVPATKPNFITLLVGTNDVYGGVSAKVFKENYRQILERLTGETKAEIYVISLPFLGSPELLFKPYNYYYYSRIKDFNQIIRELAADYNLEYIDLATPALAEAKANRSYYAADLFHPSAAGYKFWAEIIYDNIN